MNKCPCGLSGCQHIALVKETSYAKLPPSFDDDYDNAQKVKEKMKKMKFVKNYRDKRKRKEWEW